MDNASGEHGLHESSESEDGNVKVWSECAGTVNLNSDLSRGSTNININLKTPNDRHQTSDSSTNDKHPHYTTSSGRFVRPSRSRDFAYS